MTDLRPEFAVRSDRLNKRLHDNDDKQSGPECQVPAELIDYREVPLIFNPPLRRLDDKAIVDY